MSTKAIREALEDLRLSLEDHPNTRAEHWMRYVRARDEVDAIETAQATGASAHHARSVMECYSLGLPVPRTRPMCKATRSAWPRTPVDICWREEGHREDHDFRPGIVMTGAQQTGGVIGVGPAHRRPHENVGCGTMRICEVCKGETNRVDANGGGWVQGINFTPPVSEAQANAAMDAVRHEHVCTIRCTGLGAIQCPKAAGR